MVASVTAHGGKCPHGFPQGACPICNGMSGGGNKRTHKYSNPKQTMSYSEMLAYLHRMQALEARKKDQKLDALKQAQALEHTKQVLTRMMTKLTGVLNKIQNMLPQPVANAFKMIASTILNPIMNIISKFPEAVKDFNNFMQGIKMQLFVAAEKLASVFGEIKNFIQKSVSNSFKRFTKKVWRILNIFGLNSDDDFKEDERVNTEIYAFKAQDIKTLKEIMFRLIDKTRKEEHDILQ